MKDNIALCLSIFASIGTIANWIVIAIRNRKNISVCMAPSQFGLCTCRSSLFLYSTVMLIFENKSRLPISISQIKIHNTHGAVYTADLNSSAVMYNLDGSTKFHSADFPIHLSPLGAACEYISFSLPKDCTNEDLNTVLVELYTSRGKIKCKDFTIKFPPMD